MNTQVLLTFSGPSGNWQIRQRIKVSFILRLIFLTLFMVSGVRQAAQAQYTKVVRTKQQVGVKNSTGTTLSVTITPSQASYTEGQSVTVTFSGATVGDDYALALYDNSTDYNEFPTSVDIQTNTNSSSNTIQGWVSTQSSYFIVKFKAGSAATSRILGIINTDVTKGGDFGDSQPFAIVAPVATPVFCNTIAYVTPAGAGTKDGSSWGNALPGAQLAEALSTACANTTFLVGSGLYKPTTGTDQTASFSVASGVQVYGGYVVSGNTATRETFVVGTPGSTTLSGDIGTSASTDNSYHVVTLKAPGSALLDGVVITQGNSTSVGGGIYNEGGSFSLVNTSVTGNKSTFGGGGIYSVSGTIGIQNSMLSGNYTNAYGGVLYSETGDLVITNTQVTQNTAGSNGGGFYVTGASSLTATNSLLSQNKANGANGGVLYTGSSLTATITSTTMTQNMAGNGGSLYVTGGGLVRITDGIILQNRATSNGGWGYFGGALDAVITNTTMSQCTAGSNGGLINGNAGAVVILANSVMQGNYVGSTGGVLNFTNDVSATITSGSIAQNTSFNNGGVLNTNGNVDISLINTSVRENKASFGPGGVIFGGGSVTALITSCTIAQNTANSNGGFVQTGAGLQTSISNSWLSENGSGSSGGVFFSSGAVSLSVNNSVLNRNRALPSGNGAVLFAGGSLTANITSTTMSQNTATYTGGVLYASSTGRMFIDNSLFSRNLVSQGGNAGVIFVSSVMAATVTSTTMSQNTSTNGGAAIAVLSGSTTFVTDNSYYTDNIVTQGGTGGALYLNGGITSIKNSVLTGNSSPFPGGAIYMNSPTALTLANVLIKQNIVRLGGPGGGIYLNGVTGSITSSTISQNTAASGGAGLNVLNASDLTMTNNLIDRNVSTGYGAGGGIYLSATSANLDNLTVTQNTVTQNGGGIYLFGSGSLSNCVITQNTAVTGGGISVEGSSCTLINNLLSGNTASESGGAILTNATVNAINQTISGNSAPTGSAATVLGSGVLDLKNSIVWNNATPANSFSVGATASLSLTNGLSDPAATGFGSGGNNKTSDPLFKNAATGDFTLKACSPAINAGADAANTTTTDLAGLNRKAGTIDMGAYEFQGSPVSLTLTAAASKTLACTGEVLSLNATLSGGNSPLSYSWTTGSTGVTLPSSATGSPLSVTLTGTGQKSFTVTAQDAGGCTAGPVVVSVSVVNSVSITAQPAASSAVCAGVAVSVPVSVTGDVVGQQWYKNGSPVASQTATTLSLPSPTTADAGRYELIIQTTGCGSLTSSAFSLTVSEVATIIAQPVAASVVCTGSPVSVPVSVTGAGAAYQWYKGNTPVNGQTTATLSLPSPTIADAGSYALVITGGCNSTTSTAFSLTVNAVPVVTITPSATTIGGGQSTVLTASGADSYLWSTGSSLKAITVSPTQTTTYTVTGTSNGCAGTATSTVSVTCSDSVVADAISTVQTAVLGPGNCSVGLQSYGYGSTFTMTGPNNYLNSIVKRFPGLYTVTFPNITQPGTYTTKVGYTDACGRISIDTITYVVTGEACK